MFVIHKTENLKFKNKTENLKLKNEEYANKNPATNVTGFLLPETEGFEPSSPFKG